AEPNDEAAPPKQHADTLFGPIKSLHGSPPTKPLFTVTQRLSRTLVPRLSASWTTSDYGRGNSSRGRHRLRPEQTSRSKMQQKPRVLLSGASTRPGFCDGTRRTGPNQ